jgi:glycosyltransferase involved in cell wall biosynthesis
MSQFRLPKYFLVVNVDWFFLSHRLQLALRMKQEGFHVFILAKDTGRRREIENYGLNFINIDFDRSGKNPIKELVLISELKRLYKKYQPSIIHHVTIKPAIYGSIAAKSLPNTRVVNAISGLGFNFIDGRDGIVQKLLRRLMQYAFSKQVNFIFQNPDDRQLYANMGFLRGNKHCLIKGAGVDAKAFYYVPALSKSKLKVVVTARMLYDKGIIEFIEAANILKERWQGKAVFCLAGDVDLANPAGIPEDKLKELLVADYIEWVGYCSDVQSFLIQSDIACLPSYREGLPKSLIEAMAIGRPIVTTDVPGCRECVDDGYNGFLVPAKDPVALAVALEKLLSDSSLRQKMGASSRSKMERELSLEKVLNDTVAFYESI